MKRFMSILILLPLALSAMAEWTVEKSDRYQFYLDGDYTTGTGQDGSQYKYIDCNSCDCLPKLTLCVRIYEDMRVDSLQACFIFPVATVADDVDFSPYLGSLCDPSTVESPESLIKSELVDYYSESEYDYYYIVKLSHYPLAKLSASEGNHYFPAGDYPVCDITLDVTNMKDGTSYINIISDDLELTGLYDNDSQKKYVPETNCRVRLYKFPGYHSVQEIKPDGSASPKATGIFTLDGRHVSRAVPGNIYIIDGKATMPMSEIER